MSLEKVSVVMIAAVGYKEKSVPNWIIHIDT